MDPHSRPQPVQSITTARPARSEDQGARIKRYLIAMAIRTVCVVLAVVVPGPARWVFATGAVFLPYVAVVMANAVGSGRRNNVQVTESPLIALPRDAESSAPDRTIRQSAEWTSNGSPERTG
ncbi:DUF3099 domain-containing protein [Spongisporangium articulatum]|uniref:DUF3099 domain-containing protein n=1 Tax=Spongisporangium articulatum TaxID=3362603 RepID=A0ABW8ARL6_9ACTN